MNKLRHTLYIGTAHKLFKTLLHFIYVYIGKFLKPTINKQ